MLASQDIFNIDKKGTKIIYMLSSPNGKYVALKRTSDWMYCSTDMTYEIFDIMQQKEIFQLKTSCYRRNSQYCFSTDSRYFWHQTSDNIIEIIDLQNLYATQYDIGMFHTIEIHPPYIFILDNNNVFVQKLEHKELADCYTFPTKIIHIKIQSQNLWLLQSFDRTIFLDYKRNKVLATQKHQENSYFFQNSENKLFFIRASRNVYYFYSLKNNKLVRKVRVKLYSEILFLSTHFKLFSIMGKNHQNLPIGIRTYDLLWGKEEFESSDDDNLEDLGKYKIDILVKIKMLNIFRANLSQK